MYNNIMDKIEYLKIKLDLQDENNKKLNQILLKPEKIEKPINIKTEDTKFKSIKENIFKRLDSQLKNQKEYNKLYGIDETLLNVNIQPTEEQKRIKFTELIADREKLYSDEFNMLFSPYLNDDNLIRVNADLTEQERIEFVLNWDLYKNRLNELQGSRLEYNRFIDYLRDMVRKSILEKGIYGRRESGPVDMGTMENTETIENLENKKVKELPPSQPTEEEKQQTDKIQSIDEVKKELLQYFFVTEYDKLGKIINYKLNNKNIELDEELRRELKKLTGTIPQSSDVIIVSNITDITEYKKLEELLLYKEELIKFKRPQKITDLQNAFYNSDINDIVTIMKKLSFGTKGTFTYEKFDKKINELSNSELFKLYNEMVTLAKIPTEPITKQTPTEPITKQKGKGLKQKGKGLNETKLKSNEIRMNEKYYIDKQKLDNNILELRYIKNKHLTKIKTQFISDNMRVVINSILEKQQFNNEDYKKLNAKEKNLLQAILNMLEINTQIDSNSEFDKEFKILIGEVQSGNNSPELKNKLKQYIIYAMSIGKISKTLGTNMLFQLLI